MRDHDELACAGHCAARRELLKLGVAGIATGAFVRPGAAQDRSAPPDRPPGYPRRRLARLAELREGVPVAFNYPLEAQPNFLVKLGAPAHGGIGPDRDIVAFSALCTHMGGNLRGRYRHDLKAVGPCPFHLSTFDLRKGGIPVHASATTRLPQVVLVLEGDEIVATGMSGLVYGYRHNLADGRTAGATALG
jgi:arsenite oxidase small subunit